MKKFSNDYGTRVNKTVARKAYNSGSEIAIQGTKSRVATVVKKDIGDKWDTFDSLVNSWRYYNESYSGSPMYFIK
jgi:hypothetical protein